MQADDTRARPAFTLLSAMAEDFSIDPCVVGDGSFDVTECGEHPLVCETTLPDGVHADVPSPAENQIAISRFRRYRR